jgi:hypothetical protein
MNFYEDESDRHAALRNLNLICPSFCTETGVQVTMSTIRPDGHTSTIAKELSKAPTAFRSFEEIKNGAGSGNADAMDQAEAVFVAVCSSPNVCCTQLRCICY